MAQRSLTSYHSYAGSFASAIALPNMAGAPEQNSKLESGDFAYVAPGRIFYCIDPTMGAAVWSEYNSERIQGFPLHIYVSAINGNDANDGLSPGTALASLTKAETMVPNVVNSDVVIHVGRFDLAGTGSYAMPRFKRRNLRANVFLFCDGAGQAGAAGVAFNELLAPTVSGALSTSNFVDGVFVADAYRGKTLEVLSGVTANFRCTIRNNTASGIIPVNSLGTTGSFFAAGDSYRVLEPLVKIGVVDTSITGETVFAEGMGSPDATPSSDILTASFYVINAIFTLSGAATGSVAFAIRDSAVVFFGCEQRDTTVINIRMDNSSLTCGHNGADFSRVAGSYGLAILGVTNNLQWRGWGMASNGAPGVHNFYSGVLDGYTVFQRPVIFRDNITANIRGGSFASPLGNISSPLTVYKASVYCTGPGTGASTALPPQILIEGPSTTIAGIDVDYLAKAGVANCSITVTAAGTAASCIRCIRRAVCEIAAGGAPGTGLTGSASGYALLAQLGGQIWGQQSDNSPQTFLWTNFAMTGGLGYLSTDNHTNADDGLAPGAVLVTAGDQVTNSDGSSILRVT